MTQSVIPPKLTQVKESMLHSLYGCVTFIIGPDNVQVELAGIDVEGTLEQVKTRLDKDHAVLDRLGCSDIRLEKSYMGEETVICMYGTRPRTPEEVQIYDQHLIEEDGEQARREILQLKLLRKKYPHI